jgi:hypothetical protein
MQNAYRIFALLALVWPCASLGEALTTATMIPFGVRYEAASPEADQEAARRLQAALDEGPEALAQLLGDHDNRHKATIAGPFLGVYLSSLELNLPRVLELYSYVRPASRYDPKFEITSFRATTLEHRRVFAQLIVLMAKTSRPATIRAPNFNELAMTWTWISWDLSGPFLVYETDREKWLFDFDKGTGLITWVERLTNTCLSAKPAGGKVTNCQCFSIFRERPAWYLGLDRKPVCRIPAGLSIAGVPADSKVSDEDSSPMPHMAYIRTGPQTAHVDELMIDAYRPDHVLFRLPENRAEYAGVGQRISGSAPKRPRDESGKPIHGYVLLGSIVNAHGQLVANRALLYTDPRLAEAAMKSADETRVEPARMQERPVAEAIWQQFEF